MNIESLGTLKGTYRVKLRLGYFFPHFGLLFIALIGFGVFMGASPGWESYILAVVFALLAAPFLFALWRTVPTWADELKVYEQGFIYKSRKGEQTCRWEEIADIAQMLDTGNRLKLSSVEKEGGEKIVFAYKMRGLDVLNHEYAEYEYNQIPESERAVQEVEATEIQTLGPLKNKYRVRPGISKYIPLVPVLFLAVVGVSYFADTREIFALFACALPPVVIIGGIFWSTFKERNDELMVYENGFTYNNRNEFKECLWGQIVDFSTTRSGSLTGIKKDDGSSIVFANDMQGLDELKPHLRIEVKWTGPEE